MLACHRAVLQRDRPGRTSCVSDGHAHAAGLDLRDRDRECAYLHISLSLATLTLYISFCMLKQPTRIIDFMVFAVGWTLMPPE